MTGRAGRSALTAASTILSSNLLRESLIPLVAMNGDGRRGMVGVGRVDQNVVKGDARRLFDSVGGPVEDVAIRSSARRRRSGRFRPVGSWITTAEAHSSPS